MTQSHGFQYRMSSAGEMYAPARDFAHNYPQLITCIIGAFNSDRWPYVLDVAHYAMEKVHGAFWTKDETWEEICKAKEAYVKYLNICCEDPAETMEQVLSRAGWDEVHPAAKFAWLSMMGIVMTGQLMSGLRDITYHGEGPREEIKELMQAGDHSRLVMNGITKSDDLLMDLLLLLRHLYDNGVSKNSVRIIVNSAEQDAENASGKLEADPRTAS